MSGAFPVLMWPSGDWSRVGAASRLRRRRALQLWVVGLSLFGSPRTSLALGSSRCHSHRILSLPFEDARVRSPPVEPRTEVQGLAGSSHGFASWSPLHRRPLCVYRSVARGSKMPSSNWCRPCRFARLRRFHTLICGFIAPRYRSWGSSGFEPTADYRRLPTLLTDAAALRSSSFRSVDSLSPGPYPLAVGFLSLWIAPELGTLDLEVSFRPVVRLEPVFLACAFGASGVSTRKHELPLLGFPSTAGFHRLPDIAVVGARRLPTFTLAGGIVTLETATEFPWSLTRFPWSLKNPLRLLAAVFFLSSAPTNRSHLAVSTFVEGVPRS